MLKTGIKGHAELTVSEKYSAKAMGSGELDVFATPAMIALIEKAAWTSVAPELEEGRGTVGTKLDVSHIAATPLGMKVRCETELVEADGRRLVFRAEVYDEAGKVGEGVHERFIVDNEK
ncbi:MAG: thioesterase family protein, partial [Firmicutes bacterium]|nr:thioesterase family protein [Bacillota bacterium]